MSPQVLAAGHAAAADADARRRLLAQAEMLSWFTASWASLAGPLAFAAGLLASSISAVLLGVDLAIGGFTGAALLIRTQVRGPLPPGSLATVRRVMAAQFLALAALAVVISALTFVDDEHAETSALGIAVSFFTVVAMVGLGREKIRIGTAIGSRSRAAEGRDDLTLGLVAAGLALTLLGNAILGVWWLDPLLALGIAGLAARQALECLKDSGWGALRLVGDGEDDRSGEAT